MLDRQTDRKKVYLTVLTNSTYIRGVKALKRSLRHVKSRHDLVILIPQSHERELRQILERNKILDKHCVLCVKEDIKIEYPEGLDFKPHYWSNTFFKLSATNCTEFEKIILLDSDMLITHNIDNLFNKPHYSAAVSGHCLHPEWADFNSGLMVIKPSKELYNKLLNCIKPAMYRIHHKGNSIGDQDVFHEAYKDWKEHQELLLPEIYNCFFGAVRVLSNSERIRLNDIAVIHFIGQNKPWSNGCFTKQNIKVCLSFIKQRKIYEFKIYFKYLLYAAL